MDKEEIAFFEQWNIYQSIISNNYMYHVEIVKILKNLFQDKKTFCVLDLGCGDSYVFMNALNKNQNIDYLGIDTSTKALEISKINLNMPNVKNNYICGDFLEELKKLTLSYDFIILGYSLHHLKSSDKKEFFKLISKVLNKGGVLFFYDIYAKDNESSQEYLNRACHNYSEKWTELTSHEIDSVIRHVRDNDIVESELFYKNSMKKSGFHNIKKVFIDNDNLFSIYVVSK
jgi:ubiquinone/menaquinone biosynthesis C-methylase UbiE